MAKRAFALVPLDSLLVGGADAALPTGRGELVDFFQDDTATERASIARWRKLRASGSTSVILRFVLALLVMGDLSACLVLPIPQDHVVGRAVTVDPLTIKVGETTKEDMLLRLGDPDAIWTDERVFAYTWEHVTAKVVFVIVAAPYGPANIGWFDVGGTRELLLIQFDQVGLVQRVDRTQRPGDVAPGDFLRTWAKGETNAKP